MRAMLRLFKNLSLTNKYLVLTLPAMTLAISLFATLLALKQQTLIEQRQKFEARNVALRSARILAMPLWNFEEQHVQEILHSIVDRVNIVCAQILTPVSFDSPNRSYQGQCQTRKNTLTAIVPIVLHVKGKTENLGSLRLVYSLGRTGEEVASYVRPQILSAVVLMLILTVSGIGAFRYVITLPLRSVSHVLSTKHKEGERYQRLVLDRKDDLGLLAHAYNTSLERQEKTENALKDQVSLLNVLLNTLPNPVVFLTQNHKVVRCNDTFLAFLSLPLHKVQKRPIASLLKEDIWANIPTLRWQTVESEQMFRPLRGKERSVIMITRAVREIDGRTRGLVSVLQDISRIKEKEAELFEAKEEAVQTYRHLKDTQNTLIQAEKMASLGQMTAGLSHEINSPIGSSVTVSSTLQDKVSRFRKKLTSGSLKRSALLTFLDDVDEAASVLNVSLGMAQELVLGLKQISTDQTTSQKRTFDLRTVLLEILATLTPRLKGTPYTLSTQLEEGLTMNSYPGPLGQVITNLFLNALIHGLRERESGTMTLEMEREGSDGVRMRFLDDGAGIPEEDQSKVFDPFFSTRMGEEGTGLGLNVVYNIVTGLLGGQLALESSPGKGTLFDIRLPLTAPSQAQPTPPNTEVQYG